MPLGVEKNVPAIEKNNFYEKTKYIILYIILLPIKICCIM